MGESPRVLIVQFGAIGDVVMAAFSVTGIRELHPSAQIGWVIDDRCEPILDRDRLVNHAFVSQRGELKRQGRKVAASLDPYRLALAARKSSPEVAFAFQGHIKNLLVSRLSGAKEVFVMPSRDRLVHALSHPIAEFEVSFPQRERYVTLVRQKFAIPDVARPFMPQVSSPVTVTSKPLAVISVVTNSPERNYSTEKWGSVAAQLIQNGIEVAYIGAPGSEAPSVDGAHNWIGQHSLRETMGVIASASLHIGGDTGTGHIAAAYGVPTVVIVGPTNEHQYRPEGAPSIALRQGTDPNHVSVEDVIAAATSLLPVVISR